VVPNNCVFIDLQQRCLIVFNFDAGAVRSIEQVAGPPAVEEEDSVIEQVTPPHLGSEAPAASVQDPTEPTVAHNPEVQGSCGPEEPTGTVAEDKKEDAVLGVEANEKSEEAEAAPLKAEVEEPARDAAWTSDATEAATQIVKGAESTATGQVHATSEPSDQITEEEQQPPAEPSTEPATDATKDLTAGKESTAAELS
jgi:hypothetical protein